MNEKLRILKMIENGQITATEAAKLLQALDGVPSAGVGTPSPSTPSQSSPPSPTSPSPSAASHSYARDKRYDGYTPNTGGGRSTSADDLAGRFENFVHDVAPKVEKFVEVVADKINGAAERVSCAFSGEAGASQGSQSAPKPAPARSASGTMEKQVEMLVEHGHNELNLSCFNGAVRVKGYNGDKITARLSYSAKKANAYIEMVQLGGKFFLKYEPDDFGAVSIDAYVPERAFSAVKIDGMNASLDVSSLVADEIRISNANGSTALSGLSARSVAADTSNGRFSVSKITAEQASFENINGSMETDELDVSQLKLSNYNGAVSVIVSRFAKYSEYTWNVETGNAKLSINLPSMPDIAYHIKAHAAMSDMRVGLTGLEFLINEPSLIEARSTNYDGASKRIKLMAETSNAPLVIH
ncbi:MAG: DUF4097 family beta strand repeat-containing protein [Defluviitaleaceae bacterium]|nr:DUF4097 family beta strand repeat-containing protein [Defluviitaleaceae bacterium]